MSTSQSPLSLIAKTVAGLEAVLAAEIRDLGGEDVTPGRRLVTFRGTRETLYRANIHCRTAIRILQTIASFPAADEQALYRGVQTIDWSELLSVDGTLAIDPIVHSSFCTHSLYAAQLTKDAIVDQFRDRFSARPSVDRDRPDLRINLHLNDNVASIHLDASGDSLHRRGYRRAAGDAPLSEVLAAGILKLSQWSPPTPLVDFMCGSGTFVIEAALLARNIAPGLIREEFGYERWTDFDVTLHRRLLTEAKTAQAQTTDTLLFGSDLDDSVIQIAKENARRAGVLNDVRFEVGNFEAIERPVEQGFLVCNPPYDERMKAGRIDLVYARLGEVLKRNWRGWTAAILTGNIEAAKQLGMKASRRIPLRNGPLECVLLEYAIRQRGPAITPATSPKRLAAPPIEPATEQVDEVISAAVDDDLPADDLPSTELLESESDFPDSDAADFDSAEDDEPAAPPQITVNPSGRRTWADQEVAFRNRLARMGKHWAKWARRQGITCYRVYDRDVPEIPVSIDWYAGHLAIAEYERPHDRTDIEQKLWLEHMAAVAADALQVERSKIFLKMRQRQRGDSQYEKQSEQQYLTHVQEGGYKFQVNLSDYLDTGLFLDHRQTRAMVGKEAAGKRFLNLFAYTGSFTVYAAGGGATSSATVDLSNTYVDWAQENLHLNQLTAPTHEYIRDDAREFLRFYARRNKPPFDLAVVDPPTFSSSKRTTNDWDVQRDHYELLDLVLRNMQPGGKIFFSTNFRRFKFLGEELLNVSCREISRQTVPPDFRNKRIHRCWTIIRQK